MKTRVIVKFTFEGIHHWIEAPEPDPKEPILTDVRFLRTPHRHIFHVVAKKSVSHDDRDIEIIMLKRKMERHYSAHKIPFDLGQMSCEMIAKQFLRVYKLDYCSVLEDGENGAEVYIEQKAIFQGSGSGSEVLEVCEKCAEIKGSCDCDKGTVTLDELFGR